MFSFFALVVHVNDAIVIINHQCDLIALSERFISVMTAHILIHLEGAAFGCLHRKSSTLLDSPSAWVYRLVMVETLNQPS